MTGEVTPVVVVTGDDTIRAGLRACAARAGVHLDEHEGLDDDVCAQWSQTGVVLLGADVAAAALRADLPLTRELVLVSVCRETTGTPGDAAVGGGAAPDAAVFDAAAGLGAAYVTFLPAASGWLAGRLSETAGHSLRRLRAAGFRVGYADRDEATATGYVWCADLRDRPDEARQALYVSLEHVAKGDCNAGQSSTVHRSNYRTLHRRFPGLWTDLEYSNVTALGAFVADLPREVVDVLCHLVHGYPLADDEDHSALEADEVRASWGQWVASDVYGLLREHAQDVWTVLPPAVVEELWWDTVHGLDYWPDHDGHSVTWDYATVVPAFAARLVAQFRRGWRHDARYRIVRAYRGQSRFGPRFAVLFAEADQVIDTAYTRFEARVKAWAHQQARQAVLTGSTGE